MVGWLLFLLLAKRFPPILAYACKASVDQPLRIYRPQPQTDDLVNVGIDDVNGGAISTLFQRMAMMLCVMGPAMVIVEGMDEDVIRVDTLAAACCPGQGHRA